MEQYPLIDAAQARVAKRKPTKHKRLSNAFGETPDPYMAWKDDRSLLTQETKKREGTRINEKLLQRIKNTKKISVTSTSGEGLKKIRKLFATRKKAERQQFSNISNKNKTMPMPSLHTRSPY